jgi:hypothetical protein
MLICLRGDYGEGVIRNDLTAMVGEEINEFTKQNARQIINIILRKKSIVTNDAQKAMRKNFGVFHR